MSSKRDSFIPANRSSIDKISDDQFDNSGSTSAFTLLRKNLKEEVKDKDCPFAVKLSRHQSFKYMNVTVDKDIQERKALLDSTNSENQHPNRQSESKDGFNTCRESYNFKKPPTQ